MQTMTPLHHLPPERFETPAILRKVSAASRRLAELKGLAASIPNQSILINTLALQEAKDSSAIENIVTTHDELFRDDAFPESPVSLASKEVARYRQALYTGFNRVRETGLLTANTMGDIQTELECNTPPQEHDTIVQQMTDLERFINTPELLDTDPLVKMALIHHRFESIHPFYDGNGRTGRIINVLYLVREGLLDIPVLYLSRHIVRNKAAYYRLLQEVRDSDNWEEWVLYMLDAVEQTSADAIQTITAIRSAVMQAKHGIRSQYRFYSQDLINNLFTHPYTKIEYIEKDLHVSRMTAAKYLEELVQGGFMEKRKIGRANYYINTALYAILAGEKMRDEG